jgi:hypothetical protein
MNTFHGGGGIGTGVGIREARELFEGQDGQVRAEGYSPAGFLGRAKSIYKDEVDSRHFEVVLRRMRDGATSGQVTIVGVRRAAARNERHFLARASFADAVSVLMETADLARMEPLDGYKERMMVGRKFREP